MPPPKSTSPGIPALTGMRSLAAYLVFAFHYPPSEWGRGEFRRALVDQGHLGVGLFFVLSGFLIAYRYSAGASLRPGWMLGYLRNRFARIYPMYFAVCLLTLSLLGQTDPAAWWIHLTLGVGFGRPELLHLHQAWSLSVEESFYFFAPLTFLGCRRLGFFRGMLASTLLGAALSLLLSRMSFLAPLYSFDGPLDFFLRSHWGRLVEFGFGSYLGLRMARGEPWRAPWRLGWTYTGILGGLAMSLLGAALAAGTVADPEAGRPLLMGLDLGAFPCFAGFFIWGLATEDTAVSRFLGRPLLVLLGQSSYLFYLLHVGPIADALLEKSGMGSLAFFAVLNGLCVALFRWGEEPIWRWLRLKAWPAAPRAPDPVG